MANLEVLVGKSYPATDPYQVGREKVREFARSIYAEHPYHLDVDAAQAAGFQDVVAPTTFPIIIQVQALDQFLNDPEAQIDLSQVVHGDQRFIYTRPIVAGDVLSGVFTVKNVRKLGNNAMVTASVEISDEAGELVVTANSSLMIGGGVA